MGVANGSLEVKGLSKAYGAVRALRNVSVTFVAGEIHALVGENGAGKSTFVSVLSGFAKPDAGHALLNGRELPLGHAVRSKEHGVAMVHQHFTLAPELTVEENLALGRLGKLGSRLELARLTAPARAVAKGLRWRLDFSAKVRDLPVGIQQKVEVVRVLAEEAQVVIFDEPTAVLAPEEVQELFDVLSQLKGEGKIVILIAHRLSEVMAIADQITVLRRGEVVASSRPSETDEEEVARWMVGDMPHFAEVSETSFEGEGLVARHLRVLGDRGEVAIPAASFQVPPGEILGFGGVDGNGQVELAEALALVRPFQGSLEFDGQRFQKPPAYIPQDRQVDGLAPTMSISDNLLVTGHRRADLTLGPFLLPPRIREWSLGLMERFEIKASSPSVQVSSLSGGNQQKVVVSRAFAEVPRVIVACNPTRGLDVRAGAFVHRQILEARAAGAAIVLFSSDLEELAALATRTLFLSRGELKDGTTATDLVGGGG